MGLPEVLPKGSHARAYAQASASASANADASAYAPGSAEGAAPPAPPSSQSDSGSAPAGSTPKRKPRTAPPVDETPPEAGTLARKVYDAILSDPPLRDSVVAPADFARRIADPDAYRGVDVLAEVKRAGEWSVAKRKVHKDGRSFLRNWLKRQADDVAATLKPAGGSAPKPKHHRPSDDELFGGY